MKKMKFTIIIIAVIMLFTSCITQKDVMSLENSLEELENEYEITKNQKSDLESDIEDLKANLAEIENEKVDLNKEIEEKQEENETLNNKIPVPMFCFDAYQFNAILGDVQNEVKIGKIYYDGWIDPVMAKTKDGIKKETVELDGDINTDEYLCIIYHTYSDNGIVKSIRFEYSSEEYKDEYEDLIKSVGPALIMTLESPSSYKNEYFRRGRDIIEEGSYMDGLIKIVREETEMGECITIYMET